MFTNDMKERSMKSLERCKSYIFDVEEITKQCEENRLKYNILLQQIDELEKLLPKLQLCQNQTNAKLQNQLTEKDQMNKQHLQIALQTITQFQNEMSANITRTNFKFPLNDYTKQIEQVQHIIGEENHNQTVSIKNIIENHKKLLQNIEKPSETFEINMKNIRPMQHNLTIIMDVEKQFKTIANEIETNVERTIQNMIGLSQVNNQLSSNMEQQIDLCVNMVTDLKEKEILKYPSNGKFYFIFSKKKKIYFS